MSAQCEGILEVFQIPALPNSPSCDLSIGRPHLSVTQDPTTVQLTWNLFCTSIESIQHYEIFASKRTMSPMFSDWKKVILSLSLRGSFTHAPLNLDWECQVDAFTHCCLLERISSEFALRVRDSCCIHRPAVRPLL